MPEGIKERGKTPGRDEESSGVLRALIRDVERHEPPSPPESPRGLFPRGSLDRIWNNQRLVEAFPDFQDVKEEEFRKVTKGVEEDIGASEEEKQYLRLLRLWWEAQNPLQTLRTNPRLVNPEDPRAVDQSKLIKEPDTAAILDPPEVREAIRDFYYQIRRGQYEDMPDLKIFGEGYPELKGKPLYEQIALRFLDAWLVHPDPTQHGEVAQWVDNPERYPVLQPEIEKVVKGVDHKTRRQRFKEYQAAHDGVWNQYVLKRWPEMVEAYGPFLPNGEEFNLMTPAIKKEQTYDPNEDRGYDGPLVKFGDKDYKWDGKKWYMGDYLKWAGFTPEELVNEWDAPAEEGGESLRDKFRKGKKIKGFIAYYWQVRRAINTAIDLNALLMKEKKINPLNVREHLAGRYTYISESELNWIRTELIRPLYEIANEGAIAILQRTAAEGKFP
ncbi:MAG TPA: hypothetical protein VMX77_01965, partial [Candidatus Bathyarchaeia archaeon]|nr:hypothetical protein [Candidatus Bathyarchaeia archaeon]